MRKLFHIVLYVLCVCAASSALGCQSRLHVRVEKLEGVRSTLPDGSAAALLIIRDALAGLEQICTECRLTYGDATVEQALSELAEAQRQARALMPLVDALLARTSSGGRSLAAQVRALHQRAAAIMPRVDLNALDGVIQIEMNEKRRAAMQALSSEIMPAIEGCAGRLASVTLSGPGFGGFRQGGVYQINPGDPMYDRVLTARPAAQPITEATLDAAGDTSVMLVQESPAQMRLYRISNDPSTILRNATFIMNKVLHASVKFNMTD